jgi:hypothetical protein
MSFEKDFSIDVFHRQYVIISLSLNNVQLYMSSREKETCFDIELPTYSRALYTLSINNRCVRILPLFLSKYELYLVNGTMRANDDEIVYVRIFHINDAIIRV